MADLGIGYIDVVPRTDKFVTSLQSQMSKAFGMTQKMLGGATGMTTAATLGFVALGAVAVKAISSGISATQEWASEVRALQRVTGQSAESASGLLAVTGHLGIDSATAARSFALFAKNVQTNNKALDQYGIATRDASGQLLPFDTILGNTADAVAALPPGLQQAAAAKQLFGRAGVALLPLLQKESTGINDLKQNAADLGLIMSQQDVDAAKSLTLAQNDLHEAMKGASISIGKDFIPMMTSLVEVGTKAVELFTKIPQPIKDMTLAFTVLFGALAAGRLVVGALSYAFGPAVAAIQTAIGANAELTGSAGTAAVGLEAEGAAAETAAGQLTLFSGAAGTAGTAAATGGAKAGASWIGGFFARAAALAGPLSLKLLGGVGAAAYVAFQGPSSPQLDNIDQYNAALGVIAHNNELIATSTDGVTTSTGESVATLKSANEAWQQQAIAQGASNQAINYAVDHSLLDYNTALAATTDTTKKVTLSLKDMFGGLDTTTTKLADVPLAMQDIMSGLQGDFRGLKDLSASSGQDFTSIGNDLVAALNDPALTLAKLPDLFANTIGKMRETMQAWRGSIVSALGGAGSALDQFANKQNVSVVTATQSLNAYTNQVKSMGTDLVAIHRKYGKSANDFIQWATEQGLAQRGLADAVAKAGQKDGKAFVDSFNQGNTASDQFAKTMTHVLGKAFDDLLTGFKKMWNQILVALGQDPVFHINTGPAEASIANLNQSIKNLPTSTVFNIHGTYTPPPNGPRGGGGWRGGMVTPRGFAMGGPAEDTIPAMLSPGEFVMRRSAVSRIGAANLARMNSGGMVGGGSSLSGSLTITNWRRGIGNLDAEAAWEDAVTNS